jgi:hypothetical protein
MTRDKLSAAEAATNPIGRKNAQKTSETPANLSRAPIGATHGTALTYDFLCLFVANKSSPFVRILSDGRR